MYRFPEELRQAYESSPASFVYYQNIDGKPVPVLASEGFCRYTGTNHEAVLEWLATGIFERMHPDDVGMASQMSMDFLNKKGPYNMIFRCRLLPPGVIDDTRENGQYTLIHGRGAWQTMPDGTELALIAYTNLSETQENLRKKLEQYGMFQKDRFYTDSLTGLPNINYLREFGEEKLNMIRSDGRMPMLVYSDIFSMHSYNDQYGFGEGDDLLRIAASSLRELFPKALIIRGGGDHFIMLTGVDDRDELVRRLGLVNERIKKTATGNTLGLRSGICPLDDTIDHTVDHAKHALKLIDTNMNVSVRFFSSEADERYRKTQYIVENIDRAVEEGWIRVYYQGLYRVRTEKVAAFEALARWVDPEKGIISPADFIPALQKYHQLHKLDLCMFEQVCREVRIRRENGLPIVPVSVNFSRQDFDHVDVVGRMNEIFESTGACKYTDRSNFIIEITEQDVAADPEKCQLQIKQIEENGYRLWLDDFGSGYSSFNMFSQYRFDLIKYDMELMRHLEDNSGANRLILRDLVHLAKGLKLHTLIEGVETEEQLDFVREIGCELVQGYYYHKPESLEQILIRTGNGINFRPCETREEREELNRQWFE